MGTDFFLKNRLSIIKLFESYLSKNNRHNYKQINTRNMRKLDPNNYQLEYKKICCIFRKIVAPVSYFSDLK